MVPRLDVGTCLLRDAIPPTWDCLPETVIKLVVLKMPLFFSSSFKKVIEIQ